jgi:single-strand DNA-binding protein
MADLNKVFIIGRLTRDLELRRTQGGKAVVELNIVTGRKWKGNDGQQREDTLFVGVTCWDKQAENCCQYLRKGSTVHVEGSLKMDSWDDKNTGEKRSKIGVLAEYVQFLDKKGESASSAPEPAAYSAPPQADRGRVESAPARPAPVQDSYEDDDEDEENRIPF